MRTINQTYLMRGAGLLDFGIDQNGSSLEVADYIGMVCAYLRRGMPISDMQLRLSDGLSPDIGIKAYQTFQLFEDQQGRGLWATGPAQGDVWFTNQKLARLYPCIGLELEAKRAAEVAGEQSY